MTISSNELVGKHIVCYSGGHSSALVAIEVVRKYGKENCVLYFKSSVEAYHSVLLIKNPVVAGTIMPDKVNRLITRGAQLQGEMLPDTHPLAQDAYQQYHKKYPMALAIKGEVFTVLLSDIKMTDSKLGFGKKVYWKSQEQSKGVTNL